MREFSHPVIRVWLPEPGKPREADKQNGHRIELVLPLPEQVHGFLDQREQVLRWLDSLSGLDHSAQNRMEATAARFSQSNLAALQLVGDMVRKPVAHLVPWST